MGLFKSSPGAQEPERQPKLAQCHVYCGPKGIAVAAVHSDVSGRWASEGQPIVLLPTTASPTETGKAVRRALDGSRQGLTEGEAETQWQSFPHVLGESGWKSVEDGWDLISVSHERTRNMIAIHPMRRYEGGGWIMQHGDPEYSCSLDVDEIGQLLIQIISRLSLQPRAP